MSSFAGTDAQPSVGTSGRVVVEASHLAKRFILRTGGVGDLRERFQDMASVLRRRQTHDERIFWALKDVSFQVTAGQTLGIVGHNGSGKSTLLKMLTGILKPTSGSLKLHGRVGALIEVGAGFHPDLSGRENVYLNGSILGLSRRDIDKRLDAIVHFAGLEQFIDTPVKRYSSGMYMRLGFSVAAHTDPDILLIDEVLAVGDTQFQRKCLRHLKEFAERGGTVVFVSHAMGQVIELCRTCLWLDHGEVLYQGDAQQAIDHYMALVSEREDEEYRRNYPDDWAERERLAEIERQAREAAARAEQEAMERARLQEMDEARAARETWLARRGTPLACRIEQVTVKDAAGQARDSFVVGEPMQVEIRYHFGRALTSPVIGIDFFRDDGLHMFTTSNWDHQFSLAGLPPDGVLMLDVAGMNFNQGEYRIQAKLFAESESDVWHAQPEDVLEEAARFRVEAGRFALGAAFLSTGWQLPGGRKVSGLAMSEEERQQIVSVPGDGAPTPTAV